MVSRSFGCRSKSTSLAIAPEALILCWTSSRQRRMALCGVALPSSFQKPNLNSLPANSSGDFHGIDSTLGSMFHSSPLTINSKIRFTSFRLLPIGPITEGTSSW
ncbi:hypothetical protein OGAPHI_003203 [Ogataea philodendri]|uniref:Uncharacterized protein n=1 Tax=Ogataea philodendri TaxID=1378263 RepID=A0A9P8T5V9_9ASCO|nr:uncharacterized protein OGAPHI_003203 [Ogataea philodendri]KAH3666754.1 hypothetical protein OGAPHI_003203 [Ogataea philodendri]